MADVEFPILVSNIQMSDMYMMISLIYYWQILTLIRCFYYTQLLAAPSGNGSFVTNSNSATRSALLSRCKEVRARGTRRRSWSMKNSHLKRCFNSRRVKIDVGRRVWLISDSMFHSYNNCAVIVVLVVTSKFRLILTLLSSLFIYMFIFYRGLFCFKRNRDFTINSSVVVCLTPKANRDKNLK